MGQPQQTASGSVAQPAAPATTQGSGRGRGRGATSSSGFRGEGPTAPARIFTMTQQEANTSNTMVSGNLTIDCSDVYVLIDPGASHSFVAPRAVDRVGLIAYGLECPLWVSQPKCNPSVAE